jgi:hypothetical protein
LRGQDTFDKLKTSPLDKLRTSSNAPEVHKGLQRRTSAGASACSLIQILPIVLTKKGDEKQGSSPFPHFMVRPAGVESSRRISLTLNLLLGPIPARNTKKAGNGFHRTTTCLSLLVRPAGVPSINSGQAHLRPTDSKTSILKIEKCYNSNQLILFNFFN